MKDVKDVLAYTEQDLVQLSKEELLGLLKEVEYNESMFNTAQITSKTMMNALYGALANRWFPLFNEAMAAAITGNGRFFIQKLAIYIEDTLQKMLKSEKPYVIYNDTDSCIGSTIIKTSLGNIKIEDLFNKLNGDIKTIGIDNFVKNVNDNILAASLNEDFKLQNKKIKYVMKHKVKKRMFKITCNNDEVTITEDHSIIILRNNMLIEIKPKDIIKGDKLIKICEKLYMIDMISIHENFEIEDLGIQEEWVYDIEVDDNHNFFGNNILLHNSCYYQIEAFVNMYIEKNPGKDINEYVQWADDFEKKVIQPTITKCIDDFAKMLNAYDKEKIGAKREIIADVAVFTAKKKYYARVRDDEGARFPSDSPKIKVTGLEIIKGGTPKWSQKYLKEAIPHILDKDELELRNWIRSIKQNFIKVDPNQIAATYAINSLDYELGEKGITMGARSALSYNKYLKENGLENTYAQINPGDKCKRIFLQTPNKLHTDVVSFTSDSFVKELDGIIDYDTNFQKNFLKPLEIMTAPMNYDLEKETESLDDW